jgi:hypothetical protein
MKQGKHLRITKAQIELVDGFVMALKEKNKFGLFDGEQKNDSVHLEGLVFPTIALCEQYQMSKMVVERVCGKHEFCDAKLSCVNLTRSDLSFSVWHNCSFFRIQFDSAILTNCRFFGCEFNECTFVKTHVEDSSFSLGRIGGETAIRNCTFQGAFFKGASSHNLVCENVHFQNCKLDRFTFESAMCNNVKFTGMYESLVFSGQINDSTRNRVKLDLSEAQFGWFEADNGIEMTDIQLPLDGSCLILKDRISAINELSEQLLREPKYSVFAKMLKGIYGERGPSPLNRNQTMILLSRLCFVTLDEDIGETESVQLIQHIRKIAQKLGVLVK